MALGCAVEGGLLLPGWDELLKREEYQWKEPHPSVVSLAQELRDRGLTRVLDLGCGAGRHTAYLSGLGLSVWGMDPAVSGLARAADWLRSEGLRRLLVRSDMRAVPFRAGSFDCVISIYVLHHGTKAMIARALSEIRRVLVPGGVLLAVVQSKEDWKYGTGRPVERDTWIPQTGDEAGLLHHFFDSRSLRDLLHGFSIRRIEPERRNEKLPTGRSIRHGHWDVLAERQ